MVISDTHKFIFFHVPKTAGSSVFRTLEDIGTKVLGSHTPIDSAKEYLGLNRFISYFKFSFVRNPWDRVVSMYEYNRQGKKLFESGEELDFINTFEDFVIWRRDNFDLGFLQSNWITKENEVAIDFVGRYERLQLDFDLVCKRIDIESRKLKEFKRSERGPYQAYYNLDTISIVADMFSEDIKRFGYIYGS